MSSTDLHQNTLDQCLQFVAVYFLQMEKLISVSQTVEHSSTIISDILSRILNETVMREETICRICFNLLNDIDYHLKEAQEKTGQAEIFISPFIFLKQEPHLLIFGFVFRVRSYSCLVHLM